MMFEEETERWWLKSRADDRSIWACALGSSVCQLYTRTYVTSGEMSSLRVKRFVEEVCTQFLLQALGYMHCKLSWGLSGVTDHFEKLLTPNFGYEGRMRFTKLTLAPVPPPSFIVNYSILSCIFRFSPRSCTSSHLGEAFSPILLLCLYTNSWRLLQFNPWSRILSWLLGP